MRFEEKTLRILQMRANVEALLSGHYKLILPGIDSTLVDRIMFHRTEQFMADFLELVKRGCFLPWNHAIRAHGVTARRGWRENVMRYSCQIIEHHDQVECDFDYWNPGYGMAPIIGHLIEWLHNRQSGKKTDSFKVARGLRKRGLFVPDVQDIMINCDTNVRNT